MKRMISAGMLALMTGAVGASLLAARPAEAQRLRYPSEWGHRYSRNGDFDRDGIRNRYDIDWDNDGIRNGADRNPWVRNRRSRVRGWRGTTRQRDWDRDGVRNRRDRYPRNPRRR